MKQPIFYPGKQLCASDLIKLEEYAFSRTNIISPDSGVVLLFNKNSPQTAVINGKTNFILTEVYGITPAGRPVAFKAEGDRRALKLEYSCNGKVLFWDIYVEDKHPDANHDEQVDGNEKYRLTYLPVDKDDMPVIKNDNLYLGRYKLTDSQSPQIDAYPFVYSLASFNFPSRNWQEWTFPIREALRQVAKKNSDNQSVVFFIKQILYNYPFWPLSQLFRACFQLQWLRDSEDIDKSLEEGPLQQLQVEQQVNPLPAKLLTINPQNIPEELSKIIDDHRPFIFHRIGDKEYDIINGELIITAYFTGKNELKFKFKERMDASYSLTVNNVHEYEPTILEEKDFDDTECYYYLINVPETEDNQTLRISLPKTWDRGLFSLYYRAIFETA